MRFSKRQSLLVAGIFALGATIVGPAVLTFEYEPVPRGFAIMLVFLAIGLALSGRIGWASLAGAVAFLYHAPTAIPFWALFGVVAFRARRWRAFASLVASVAIVIVLSRIQPGIVERQPLFSRISPFLEQLQRMRASYNWVSAWNSEWFWHYGILVGFVIGAVYRIRDRLQAAHRIIILGLPVMGVLSVPASYVALEELKWSLISQFQPARAVLFITAMAVIMGCAAAIDAAMRQRYPETFAWLLTPFAIPALIVVTPPYKPAALLVVGVLAITATAVLALDRLRPRIAPAAVLMLAAGAMLSIPVFAGVRNYPELWTPGIRDVSNWARTHTDQGAVFAFPYAGKRLYPGLFRAEALRAVYVDWKGGGQANYFEDLAREWWSRWESTMAPGSNPEYSSKDVDYIGVQRDHADPNLTPVYANNEYVVYRSGAEAR
jgi:hypothetical protein